MCVVRFAAFGFAVVHGSLRRGGGEGGWPAGWLAVPPSPDWEVGEDGEHGEDGCEDGRLGGWEDGWQDGRSGGGWEVGSMCIDVGLVDVCIDVDICGDAGWFDVRIDVVCSGVCIDVGCGDVCIDVGFRSHIR